MTDEPETSSRQELEKAFDSAVEFIGREWLESKFEENFDSEPNENTDLRTKDIPELLNQYYLASVYLGKREEKFPELIPEGRPNELALRFTNLGNFIRELDSAGTVSPEGELLEKSLSETFAHRLKNPDEYEQTSYELQTGHIYSKLEEDVFFIEEGDRKAPDIWIPHEGENVKIECKRCDTPGHLEKRAGIYESLINKITSASHTAGIFLFDLERTPKPEEAQKVDEYLPNDLDRRTDSEISTPFGTVYIFPYIENPKKMSIPTGGMEPEERIEFFYDYYVRPVIYSKTGEELELFEDFEKATIKTRDDKVAISRTEMDYFDPMFVGLRFDHEEDLTKPIARQFDATHGKFCESDINILHIDVPYLQKLSQSDFVRLHQRLRGKLNVNSSVSSVVVTTEFTEWDENDHLNYTMFCASEDNKEPYTPVPDSFELPGYTLQDMRENPMFQ